MLDRLQWFRQKPQVWTHWSPLSSGMPVHQALVQACGYQVSLVESEPARLAHARRLWGRPWWHWSRWRAAAPSWREPEPDSQHMIWANLVLHTLAQPQNVLRHWQRLLRVDGFLMFSCLGPDTAMELRQVYELLGWPPAGAELTDMHDWGDMLVASGFADPVMDMERLTLTFESAQALLAELRQWGRNVHPDRFPALRGRRWRSQLIDAIEQHGPRQSDGRLRLTVELVYGHALKAADRLKAQAVSAISLDAMRQQLRQERPR
jgi:malonyl-CoA O-methyltransferase